MHNYITTIYITAVSLYTLHCYMFRHFRVVIRQFTTKVHTYFKLQLLELQFTKLRYFVQAYVNSQIVFVEIPVFLK